MSSGYRLASIFLYFSVSLGFWKVLVFLLGHYGGGHRLCMQAVWSWTRFQIIRYDFMKGTRFLHSHKGHFYTPWFCCGKGGC
jgi:membrane-bound metal-dependent hydrolase YbcI (DUF457 family)